MTEQENLDVQKLTRAGISTDPHELEILSKEKNYFIRASVAQNPCTPECILRELVFDTRSYVSYSLLKHNTTCSEEIAILVRAARLIKYNLVYYGHFSNCP